MKIPYLTLNNLINESGLWQVGHRVAIIIDARHSIWWCRDNIAIGLGLSLSPNFSQFLPISPKLSHIERRERQTDKQTINLWRYYESKEVNQ